MRYRTFLVYNAAGGAVWAIGFVLLGYAAGTGWRRVEHIAGRASLLLLLTIIVAGSVVLGARWVARHPDRLRARAGMVLERRLWCAGFVAATRVRLRSWRAGCSRGALGLSLTVSALALVAAGWRLAPCSRTWSP